MARSGQFGRLPRQAPDLSGAILAMLREYQNQVDQNLIDAWNNGGEVDGKKVDDARLLAHFKERRDVLSKDDPLYDLWDNRITQYTFSIEESKMRVKWDNGKVSSGDMARFYRRWEHKATMNSEFQRTLASNAGKWAADARARGRASGGRAKADAQGAAMKSIYDAKFKPASELNQNLLLLGQRVGFTTAGATSLGDMQLSRGDFGRLLEIIEDGRASDPDLNALVEEVVKRQQKYDPDFKLTTSNIISVLQTGNEGAKQLAGFDISDTDKKAWKKAGREFIATSQRVDAADTMAILNTSRKNLEEDIADARGDPTKIDTALRAYSYDVQRAFDDIKDAGLEADAGLYVTLKSHLDDIQQGLKTGTFGAAALASPFDTTDYNTNAKGNADAESFRGLLSDNFNNRKAVLEGGWAELVPQSDGNGQVILKANGQPEYAYRFHGKDEPPPLGYESVASNGLGDGSHVQVFGIPMPVSVTLAPNVMSPQGSPIQIDPQTKQPVMETTPSGKVSSTPLPANPVVAEAITVMDPMTGNSTVVYRTGNGTPGNDYVYTDTLPVKAGFSLKVDANGNMAVELKRDAPGVDPKTGAFDPTSVLDLTTRQVMPNGNLNKGSYFTPNGAAFGKAMEAAFAGAKLPEDREAAKREFGKLQTKLDANIQFLTQTRSPDDPELMKASKDYAQFTAIAPLWAAGKPEAQVDADYKAISSYTYSEFWRADTLKAHGFNLNTQQGRDEGAQRLWMLDTLNSWEASHPGASQGSRDPGQRANAASARTMRDAILNPQQDPRLLKLPGMPDIFSTTQPVPTAQPWLRRVGGQPTTPVSAIPAPGSPALPRVPGPGAVPPTTTPGVKPPATPAPSPSAPPPLPPPPPPETADDLRKEHLGIKPPTIPKPPPLNPNRSGTHPGGGGPQEF